MYNYTTPLTLDSSQTDNLAKGHYIKTTLRFRQKLKILISAS